MEEIVLTSKDEDVSDENVKIELPRIISHAVGYAMAEVVSALELATLIPNISIPMHNLVVRAQLIARELTAKTSALAEIFGEPDFVSSPKMASFELQPFFSVFTEHLNQFLIGKMNCKILYEIAEESRMDVIFDARRIEMILYYLIANSLQHGRTDNKKVKLLCNSKDDVFELSVRDYGGGIPKEVQPVLLSKFTKAYDIKTEMYGMLPPRIQGVGLPLCRKLVRDMDGELTFKNYRCGAQFTIIVPQKAHGFQEVSEFFPDNTVLRNCMSSLFLFLDEQKKETSNE